MRPRAMLAMAMLTVLRARARHLHLEPVHARRQADGAAGGPHLLGAARDDQRGELPADLVRPLQDDEGVGHAQLQVPADHPGQGALQCSHSKYRPRTRRAAGPCYGILTVAVLTMATLAMALLTMATPTVAMLTIATPTMATPTRRATGPWTR
eukprot:scaffold19951_cov64-Phaeocystis_antarctica.AAC.7